jgi:hypothetical protein
VDDPGAGVLIALAAVYVSEYFATLGGPFGEKALAFFIWARQLAAVPHVGGNAELRSGSPLMGLAAATPGCRPGPKCSVLDGADTKRRSAHR